MGVDTIYVQKLWKERFDQYVYKVLVICSDIDCYEHFGNFFPK